MFFRPRQVRNHIEHFEVDEAKEIRRLYRLVREHVLFEMPFIYIYMEMRSFYKTGSGQT